MTPLASLWLPILLSAVIVFVASSLIHMVLPWHKADYPKYANEAQVLDALRPLAIPPGDYLMPRPESAADMKSAEFIEKRRRGPVLLMTVMPNDVGMGKSLALWFVYLVVIAIFAGYIAGRALPTGTDYLQVFRFIGTSAFMGLTLALWQMSIWYRRAWRITITATFDGLIYALLMAGTFGWLWPR
ncbi:MAG TPA: hypothetical protein VF761_06200 [Gemmatimonadaceae bacterium]